MNEAHDAFRIRITHAEGRQLQPDDENGLEGVVPGEVIEENTDGETLEKIEETEDDPIGQPLNIVVRCW